MGSIFSPGKLLLTSEYFVLDGALALAVPTKPGQELFFEETEDGKSEIIWEARHQDEPWLAARIDYNHWKVLESNNEEASAFILKVLKNVRSRSRKKLQHSTSYHLQTNLQFPPDFGLGSSSTLMNNLAQWAEIDPYELNEACLGGSGYDIAVAKERSAVLYQNKPVRQITSVNFKPAFLDELVFIHLNRKQDSREGISLYHSMEKSDSLILKFSQITKKVVQATTLEEFTGLMEEHEELVSGFLGLKTVKAEYFSDYGGFVKSLGAWGGDFVMASKFGDYKTYFSDRNFNRIFEWKELVL
ncbi:MAG: hypothetical protein K0M63_01710 [Weeksellaceae bacterium]|nr:hypothetical protein [Weeksellaceae bacterium]